MSAETTQAFVRDLADGHGIFYVKTDLDVWAESVTRLSGDNVVLDETEELILALARAGLIGADKAIELQVMYLREKIAVSKKGPPAEPIRL